MKHFKGFFRSNNIGKRGFTLLETLIALLVFTVGIMGVMTMVLTSINDFTRSRVTNTEVNRTCQNVETLKQAGYSNTEIFKGTSNSPVGSDAASVGYTDVENAVVYGTRLIVMQNTEIGGRGAGGNYEVYFTKPVFNE